VLGPDNHVVFEGDATLDTLQFSVVDGYLQHNLGSRPGFDSDRDLDSVTAGEQALLVSELGSLTYNDTGENDRVSFSGSEAFDFAAAAISFSVGEITVSPGVNISSTDGAIDLFATETIFVRTGSSITTVDGGIALTANQDASTSSANTDYFGLHLEGASLSTAGTGPILLEGTGIHSGSNFSAGVGIEGGTTIHSTSAAADAGEIRITGTGADGSQLKHGVISRDAGNQLHSAYGDIIIVGIGGFRPDGTGATYSGIYLTGLDIASTGVGPDAARINLDGVGGNGVTTCYGVRLATENVSISSIDGDINIVGRGGQASTTSRQSGVVIEDVAFIRSTGTGPSAANISIDGTVGTATAPQTSALAAYGVEITGDSTVVSTVDGDLTISGSGGEGGVYRHGVNINAIVASTGTGVDSGNITVSGQGGAAADGWGAFIAGSWSTVDGDINITGAGTSSPQRGGDGVRLRDIDLFASTGVGPDAGNISITGSASNGIGVFLEDSNALLTTVDGDITLSDTDDSGVLVDGFGGIASTGVGADAGRIDISNKIVSIRNLGTGISSVDGDILIASEADEVSGSGLVLSNFGVIESTGTGPDAATITLVGTASDGTTGRHGLSISGSSGESSVIRSVDGDILITGTGGDRSDPTDRFSENRGVVFADVTVESTGTTADAATISIVGSGGDSGRNGHGVSMTDGALRSVVGNVVIAGNASTGRGTYFLRTITESTGTSPLAAGLTLSGSSVQISGDVSTVDGDLSAETSGAFLSGNFVSSGSGSFLVGRSGNGSNTSVSGMSSAEGDITINGSIITVAGVHSTGVGPDAAAIRIGDSGSHQVRVSGEVSTVDGPITIQNQVDPAATQHGYTLISSSIHSTGTGNNAGTISIIGQGSGNLGGVRFWASGAIESVDGDISIVGSGGDDGYGVELAAGFQHIRSTGVGSNAASIAIVGTGGDGGSSAYGINAVGNGTGIISTIDGHIELRGTGGIGASNGSSRGLYLRALDIVSTATSAGRGNITLIGQGGGSGATSTNAGVESREVNITTIAGDIFVQGQGGSGNGSGNAGIVTVLTAITSTGSGADAGKITLDGTGGGGTTPHGVQLSTGTTIESLDGDIRIAGAGGTYDGTSTSHTWRSKGILMSGSDIAIKSTGASPHAAIITLEGTGGGNTALNNGIEMYSPNGIVTSVDGDIVMTGIAGSSGTNSLGIESLNWGEISSTGRGENAATISLHGEGTGNQAGIFLSALSQSSSYAITSIDGDITLTGDGESGIGISTSHSSAGSETISSTGVGEYAGSILIEGLDSSVNLTSGLSLTSVDGDLDIRGTRVSSSAMVSSTGLTGEAGAVSVTGTEGGVSIGNASSYVGDISIVGTNADSIHNTSGVLISGSIESLGAGADAATITIVGSSDREDRHGVEFGSSGEVVSTAGAISLTGVGGPNGYGVRDPLVKSLGADKSTAATITIDGAGNAQGGSGVLLVGGSSELPNLSTIAGDIQVTGVGGSGDGSGYRGVDLLNAYVVSKGTTKANAGSITIEGTGGAGDSDLIGVQLRSSQSDITSVAGDISVLGTAGVGTGLANFGVQIRDASLINSTGSVAGEAANIRVEGVSQSGFGVQLSGGRLESQGPGSIEVVAAGPGNGGNDDLWIGLGSVVGGPAAQGDILLQVDSISLPIPPSAPASIQSTGSLTIAPRTPSTTIGLGGAEGDLNLNDDELAQLVPGFSSIIIGDSAAPSSQINIDTVTITSPLTIAAASTQDGAGVDISAGSNAISFAAAVTPGSRSGVLSLAGNLHLAPSSVLDLDFEGADPSDGSSGYDQVSVNGGVTIDVGARLQVGTSTGYVPGESQQYIIIEDDGADPVQGSFDGLPEGAIIENFLGTPLNARISYLGVDGTTGNDVVLTTTSIFNPVYDFELGSYATNEGDETAVVDVVVLNRSEETSIATSVDVILTGGNATAGEDFAAGPITVSFAPGETSKLVPITVLGERLVEEDESILLALDNFTDFGKAGASQPTSTLTLVNDEFAPVADTGGEYVHFEGTSVLLDASGSSDFEDANELLLFEWDRSYDGVTFNADAQRKQVSLFASEGPSSRVVALRVTDTEGNSTLATTQVATLNASPTIQPQPGAALQAYNYATLQREVLFQDDGIDDTHIVTVDYGDGSPIETRELPLRERSFELNHPYPVTADDTVSYTVTMTITDDDGGSDTKSFSVSVADKALTQPDTRPTISFETGGFTIVEGESSTVSVLATLSSPATDTLVIPLSVINTLAAPDDDYTLDDTQLTFHPGQTTAQVTFHVFNELAYEPEQELVELVIPATLEEAIIGTHDRFTFTITDDGDAKPQYFLKESAQTFVEGNVYELTVELTDVSQEDVEIPLVVPGNMSNITLSSETVLIPAGSRSGTVTLTIVDDEDSEPQETFTFQLGNALQPGYLPEQNNPTSFFATVLASDALLVDFDRSFQLASEYDGTTTIVVTVDPAPETDLTLPLAYSSSVAESPADFVGPATVTIRAGDPQATFTVTLTDDTIGETDETILIKYGDDLPEGVQLSNPYVKTNLRIRDDDVAKIGFTVRSTTVYEDAAAFDLEIDTGGISFSEDVTIPFYVNRSSSNAIYSCLDGPSDLHIDNESPAGSVVLPANETTTTIRVKPRDDSLRESNERFYFTIGSLFAIPGAVQGEHRTHTVTLKDNDPTASISISETSVGESRSTALRFVVRLSAASNKKIRVPFNVYGDAKRGSDYTIIEETLPNYKVAKNYVEINPEKTSAVIRVQLKNDAVIEDQERIGLKLLNNYGSLSISNASLSSSYRDSVVIKSSDGSPLPSITQVRGKNPGSSSYSSTSTWISEGGSFRITVSMPKAADKSVYIPISFPSASGRASSNDFTTSGLTGGELKIPAGKTSASFYIHTVPDLRNEEGEKIRITMGQPVDYNGNKFGKLTDDYYQFVGIRASDQDTVHCADATSPGSLQILGSCVLDAPAGTSGGGSPSVAGGIVPYSSGSLVIGDAATGYLAGSTVFLDGNLNGVRDFVDLDGDGLQSEFEPTEPLVTTYSDGSFLIEIPLEMDRDGSGILEADEAQLVAVGGTDRATGITERMRLLAPAGDLLVTPLTTLGAKLVQQHGYSVDDAHTRVLDALRLPTFEFWRTSALSATVAGDLSAATTYPATLAVNNAAIVISGYLSALGAVEADVVGDIIYDRMADSISAADSTIDLADPLYLEELIRATGFALGLTPHTEQTSALAAGISTNSSALFGLPISADLDFLKSTVKLKIVARGDMAADATRLANGEITAAEFSNLYSAAAQTALSEAAVPGVIEPVRIAVSDASIVEGDDGTSYAEFQVVISSHFTETVTVDYATEDETATEVGGDYQSVSGTLTFNPGDGTTQVIHVPVFGDLAAELDESFQLQLFGATGGLIQRPIGTGRILANDAYEVQLGPSTSISEVLITLEGDRILIRQDGEVRLDGRLNDAAPLTILTDSGSTTQVDVDLRLIEAPNRSFKVIGNGGDDALYLNNELSASVQHVLLDEAAGRFESNSSVIEYEGFAQVANERAPAFALPMAPALEQPLTAQPELPENLDLEGATSGWSLLLNGGEIASSTEEVFTYTPTDPGDYELRFSVALLDDSVVAASQSFVLAPLNEPPVADAGGPYEAGEGLSTTLDASASSDPDLPEDLLTYQWDLDRDGIYGETGPDAGHGDEVGTAPAFDATGLDGPSAVAIGLRVIDSFGEVSESSSTVQILNVAPTPSLDSVSELLVEGTAIEVRASATDPAGVGDTISFAWTVTKTAVDNAVTEGFATGSGAEWSFTPDDDGQYTIFYTASDEDGGSMTGDLTLSVGNASPELTELEIDDWAEAVGLTLVFDDDGALDDHSLSVDWGDGVLSSYASIASPTLLEHSYDDGGVFVITVTLTDDDGGSTIASAEVFVTGARVDNRVLQVVGTSGDDDVLLNQLLGRVFVTASFLPGFLQTKSFSDDDIDRIEVFGGAGDDDLVATPLVRRLMLLDGGSGNDRLVGGSDDNLLIGHEGDDLLVGGRGRDLLIGGTGEDLILGTLGSDLLIGGYTAFDEDRQALYAVMEEWTSVRGYADRIENLRGTQADASQFAQRKNQGYFLRQDGDDATVFDDDAADVLIGGLSLDWFFANLDEDDEGQQDLVMGLRANELFEDLKWLSE